MICERYRDALTEAALAGAADTMDARLRTHLAECASCREEFERTAALAGAIDSGITQMVSGDPSPGFAARVRARIEQESETSAAWWRGWVPQLAGGLALLALVGWLAWSATQSRAPGSPETAGKKQGVPAVQPVPAHNPAAPLQEPPTLPPPDTEHAANRPPRAPRLLVARQETPPLPEVLVSGNEWNEILRLYDLSQQGRADTAAVVAEAKPLEEKLPPLAIARLEIVPLDPVPGGLR